MRGFGCVHKISFFRGQPFLFDCARLRPDMYYMKAVLLCSVLVFVDLLLACTDDAVSYYDLQNASYRGADPFSGVPLRLKFYRSAVDVRYGRRSYRRIADYHYDAKNLQGSILIRNFVFFDGTRADTIWLFTIARNTQTLTLQFLDEQNKIHNEALLVKE